MTKSTNSITLVLIGSALILNGCGRARDTAQDTSQDTRRSHGHGVYIGGGRSMWWGGSRSGQGVRAAPAPRGGFGGIGHGAAGG